MLRAIIVATLVICAVGPSMASDDMPKAKVLPNLDWACEQMFAVAYPLPGAKSDMVGLDGDNYSKPMYELHTVNGQVLKVIEYPKEPARRKEYGVPAHQITVDFMRRHPIFGWSTIDSTETHSYTFDVAHKIFIVSRILESSMLKAGYTTVFSCK